MKKQRKFVTLSPVQEFCKESNVNYYCWNANASYTLADDGSSRRHVLM